MLIDPGDEHSQARRTHAETWLWDLKCFDLVLFKHRLSHTNTHHDTGRQVKQKRWVGVCQVTYPLSAAERTAVSALPFVGMLVSVQHFAFQDSKWAGLWRHFAADKCTVCGCDAAQSLNMSSRISFTLNGRFPFGRGIRPSPTRVFCPTRSSNWTEELTKTPSVFVPMLFQILG